jgi:tRNA (guanosine-2'-O-)-methyltransferase
VVALLDHVGDPHNAAAVLRTVEGLGMQEVHAVEPEGELPLGRRVTQGCHKWLDVTVHRQAAPAIAALRERGYTLLGATERATRGPEAFADVGPVVLCMGNEHDGLTAEVAAACDGEVGIVMAGFSQSLNVSVAAALLLSRLVEGRPRGLDEPERTAMRARYFALSVKRPVELLERGGIL